MMTFHLSSPRSMCLDLAARARRLRLSQNLTQHALSEKAGIAFSTLRKFERTGDISLERLVLLGIALGVSSSFDALFAPPPAESLDEIERRQHVRQRARKGRHGRP